MNEEKKAGGAVETGAKPKSKAAPDAIAEEGEGGVRDHSHMTYAHVLFIPLSLSQLSHFSVLLFGLFFGCHM